MAGIPTNFQAISNVLASYNFVDISSGTGYITLYAGATQNVTPTTTYRLSNNAFYSDPIKASGSTSNAAYTNVIDLDFDVVLNRPLDIEGIALINVSTVGDTNQARFYVNAIIRKYAGSTETDIASNTSNENESTTYHCHGISINVPLTRFKVGETLRLTIQLFLKYISVPGSVTGNLSFDPMNRSDSWDTTGAVPSKLVFQCPVRLNL